MQTEFEKAYLKAQKAMGSADKDGKNPHFKSTYSTYTSVVNCVKGPLNDNGLTFRHTTRLDEQGWHIGTILVHADTGQESPPFEMLCTMGKMQEMGSAITYAKRYTLQSICGIPSDDDDGHVANKVAPTKVTFIFNTKDPKQVEKLWGFLKSRGVPEGLWDDIAKRIDGQPSSEVGAIIAQVLNEEEENSNGPK